MSISLTIEEAQARLRQPQRLSILSLAVNEDIKSIFPLHLTGKKKEDDKIIGDAFHRLVLKVLLRAITIVYDENLDS
jgi:hypothetical protein